MTASAAPLLAPPAGARETRVRAWGRPLAWAALFTALGVLNAVHFYLGQPAAANGGFVPARPAFVPTRDPGRVRRPHDGGIPSRKTR